GEIHQSVTIWLTQNFEHPTLISVSQSEVDTSATLIANQGNGDSSYQDKCTKPAHIPCNNSILLHGSVRARTPQPPSQKNTA
ncbi:hypothetical protein OQJ46_16525, partial [Microbulbifer thermotolerans]|uniref:hypothetical protein n=1 Tax=Microbulbifer thermotolerans TaxID=252514 RepID=UPI00224AAC8E